MAAAGTLTSQELDYVAGVLLGKTSRDAAIHAGYSEKSASAQGTRLSKRAKVKDEIERRRLRISQRLSMEKPDVLTELVKIATADPNELVSLERGACRYCNGHNHAYHWRSTDELDVAVTAYRMLPAKRQAILPFPSDEGGFGYRFRAAPHDDCPNCEGEGVPRTVLRDTRNLSPGARALYAGVKETQHGIEVKMRDQDGALDKIARILGMYDADNQQTHKVDDPLMSLLGEIMRVGSRAPIKTNTETDA